MLTGHLPHTSRSKQALACGENVEPGQELARTSCPAYSALPSLPLPSPRWHRVCARARVAAPNAFSCLPGAL